MASTIAEYALIGDCETAALVGRNGSIDWLCWPRFDSPACFAALLGTPANGYWLIRPGRSASVVRRYRPHTLILETTFETDQGRVTLIDFMPTRERAPRVIRIVRGDEGALQMRMELCPRFDYGRRRPSVEVKDDYAIVAAKSERLGFHSSVPMQREEGNIIAAFALRAGETARFELADARRSRAAHSKRSVSVLLKQTERSWKTWTLRRKYQGPHVDAVERSLITLQALTYAPTGGIISAPTTSLPEIPGGAWNWDYRYCWLRDATYTLLGFVHAGYVNEARAWKEWLVKAAGENPGRLRILYDVAGKTIRSSERTAHWLKGFDRSIPVRIGNAASKQLQLDVFGELADAVYQAGIPNGKKRPAFQLLTKLLDHLEKIWHQPDHGIWELRGRARQYTHSKVMCWVAFDRSIRAAERIGFTTPLAKWRAAREQIHNSVCSSGYSPQLRCFVQSYGSRKIDASLLLLPLVGFLPPHDARIRGTVRQIEKRLLYKGLVMRWEKDRRHKPEGAFLPCSFWLADYYDLAGRKEEAKQLLGRLLRLRNDVGLLSEEYDIEGQSLSGNFPQALSHVALVNTVINLHTKVGPAKQRSSGGTPRRAL